MIREKALFFGPDENVVQLADRFQAFFWVILQPCSTCGDLPGKYLQMNDLYAFSVTAKEPENHLGLLAGRRREVATATQQAEIAMAIKVHMPVDVSDTERLAFR